MSNGHPPLSTATYIIICSGRTQVLAAKDDSAAKIVAANSCAKDLCSFIQSNFAIDPNDFKEISDKQHELMDGMLTLKKHEVDQKVTEMFALLDELEDKFEE